ncbi:4-diphosphocytidyl-2-C-methyl-D-erythritol kinase [bacterium BMS3Abin03]|nr:4-diphosphocytidyl-2-C-methyl-D-erythritol kinase [bacterium BMS3Abin03]
MEKIAINSPAKINIGLNVINRRKDGFHNIETIFYPLLLADKLTIEKAGSFKFESSSKDMEQLKENLIFRAIEILEEFAGRKFNVHIYLEKNIPIGAGLGGGSSNAASTLKALIKLFNVEISNDKLREIALDLGSDVPFFLNSIPCFAGSRGENITPVRLSIPNPILVVNPGIHISTKKAFEKIKPQVRERSLHELINQTSISIDDLKKIAENDFESYTFNKYPAVKQIKEKLYEAGAEFAMMTGTGSTVFGIFTNLQKARRAESEFSKKYFTYLNFPVNKGSIT